MAAIDKRHSGHFITDTGKRTASLGKESSNGWNQMFHEASALPNFCSDLGYLVNLYECNAPMFRHAIRCDHFNTDLSDNETCCEYDGATQMTGSKKHLWRNRWKMPYHATIVQQQNVYQVAEEVCLDGRSRRNDSNLKEKNSMLNSSSNNGRGETVQSARYNEPKKYKYFREMIETSCDLVNWRLQEKPCVISSYDPCIICATISDGDKPMDCRFYNRMLRDRNNPKLCRHLLISDIEKIKSSFIMDEVNVCVEQFIDEKFTTGKPKEKAEAAQMAAYVLQCVYSNYEKVLQREEEAISGFCESEAYYNHAFGAKQVCDSCRFAILNAHFCCRICGSELCIMCYKELGEKDIFRDTLCRSMEQLERYGIKKSGASCNGNHGRGYNMKLFQEKKCYCPRFSPLSKFPIETICVIEDQARILECFHFGFLLDAYARFKAQLTAHNPIIVENVNRHPRYRRSLWTQEAFEKIVACDRSLRILDTRDFSTVMIHDKPCSLKMFWSKFGLKRNVNDNYMKIKDFPESKLFSSIAPEQYINLYEVMPFLDYTHVNREESGRGRLNLLNLFNDKRERPDPGPKVYICFGLYNAPHLASTPLHLDVSDAVNFYLVEQRLDAEGFRGYHRERALREPEKAGAIWKIFHPNDNMKIRAAIEEEEWKGDVIHNQDVVVTREMMDFFKERGIECRMFVQNEGDVVFIPSGAAHQVQNINSCIKIAEDFVAPEGIDYTVTVTDELRFLRAKDDLVQVDKLLHLACAAAAAVLQNNEPGLTTSSLPQ
ncbi:Lysine-specific demethylase 3B [Dirofilaria immitis]|nr:Lysine-specific demethylase 3B [Dirofilaria immitis]